jgi:hypothetical protein
MLLLVALALCMCLTFAGATWAGEAATIQAGFTPDELGASTNLSVSAKLAVPSEGASPVRRLTLYAPAGITVDTRGAGTCTAAMLQRLGPSGCPADARVGFGGGVAVLWLPGGPVREPYTVDFFFAPREHGRLTLLAYASAVAPVAVELVVVAKQVPTPKPYGLGFSVEVPPISTIPGASNAAIETAFATLGSANVAYYENVHGKRTLVHIKGIVAPKTCPPGGFPAEGTIDFADGSVLTLNPTIPCPHK